MGNWFAKECSHAAPGYRRGWVPVAALCIHLSIGQAYAWSVFNIPLTRILGVEKPGPGDWSRESVIWVFSLAIVCLGLSAAFGGKWLERVGPRLAMFASALCFSSGLFLASLAVATHSLVLLYAGYGVIGGCGLGLGYIAPVSTLIRWFPDRPGMATGLAIMGFGGGALIAAPLSVSLMGFYATHQSTGVAQTFATLGAGYLAAMLAGAAMIRIPPPGWTPASGKVQAEASAKSSGARNADRNGEGNGETNGGSRAAAATRLSGHHVHADTALRTPQFYLLWAMLCFNVSAGIGILGKAADMVQDIFGVTPAAGAWFVTLLSVANMAGRFVWSSASDLFGRKTTYAIYFGLGGILYATLPLLGRSGSRPLFEIACLAIMTMYGGGFATIPAYLRDLFGTMHVGAIHGRLLTAWSIAGVAGPVLLTRWAERAKAAGAAGGEAYFPVMYLMAGLLAAGFVCNLRVSPVDPRHHFHPES
jgi:MFS family permease